MKFNLGFLRDRHGDDQPQAHYMVPIPDHAGSGVMVSFFDKETMLPRSVVWSITRGVLSCTLPPMKRVELRLAWIDEGQLEGVRYVLGPASKFRTHVGDTSVGGYDLL